MLLYFAPYCVKKPRRSRAMPTFFALSGPKYGYPKWQTYLLNITKRR